MDYWLGIDVGSTVTAAAVCRAGEPAQVVALGDDAVVVPSVLYVGEQGEVVVGQAALDRGVADPDRVVRGFVGRVGDQVPLVCGGQTYTAAQLVAMVIGWVVQRVSGLRGGAAESLVVTHPADWGDYKCQVLAAALDTLEVPVVRLCAQPQAAVAGSGGAGPTVAVYDLGGSSCAATVVRASDTGQGRVVGSPPAVAQLGGADFDDAVFGQVLATVPALACLDADDPATLAATAALRRACTRAKEALSADTEVTIPVTAPGIDTSVRVHRAEFDDLIRPQLAETLSLLRHALHSAQLDPSDLDTVLLVGGSVRIPLVAQLVSTELNQPVTIDTDPATTIARGAATLARNAATPAASHDVADPDPDPEPEPSLPPPHLPQRPTLTAIPLDVEPADTQRRTGSRRGSRIVVAGALALLTAAGVAAVPFLLARSDTNPSANAGPPPAGDQRPSTTPTPSAPPAADSASTPPNAGLGGEVSSRTAGSGEVVRTTTASPGLAAAPAKPGPPVAPASAAPPSWVTSYTWTTSWSSPPPTPTPTTTRSTDPPPTTTTSRRPPTTTTAPTTAKPAPSTKPSPSQQRRPTT